MKDVRRILESRSNLIQKIKLIDEEIKRCREDVEYIISETIVGYESKLKVLRTHYYNQLKGINYCLDETAKIDDSKLNNYFKDLPKVLFYEE